MCWFLKREIDVRELQRQRCVTECGALIARTVSRNVVVLVPNTNVRKENSEDGHGPLDLNFPISGV
jgi:hypothetical protein